jgi:DNA-binding NarL/FixJ family response regulator
LFNSDDPSWDATLDEEKMRRFRVLIITDHDVTRLLLTVLLNDEENMEVAGEGIMRTAAVEMARKRTPDVILMDRSMTKMNDRRAIQAIQSEFPQTNVIGFSLFSGLETGQAMLDAGAISGLSKDHPWHALLLCIREAVKLNFSLIRQYRFSYHNQVAISFNALPN